MRSSSPHVHMQLHHDQTKVSNCEEHAQQIMLPWSWSWSWSSEALLRAVVGWAEPAGKGSGRGHRRSFQCALVESPAQCKPTTTIGVALLFLLVSNRLGKKTWGRRITYIVVFTDLEFTNELVRWIHAETDVHQVLGVNLQTHAAVLNDGSCRVHIERLKTEEKQEVKHGCFRNRGKKCTYSAWCSGQRK
jgi:hypothetical protein